MGFYSTLLWSGVLFGVATFSGFTSFRVRNNYGKAMIYLNAASTGVILAAAFTHLLPDAINDLKDFSYPVAPAMSLTGFLIMVLVETVLHSHNLKSDHEIAEREHQSHDCADHDNVFGADPVHNFQLGMPSSSFTRVKGKAEGNLQSCPTLQRQCNDNAKKKVASRNLGLGTAKRGRAELQGKVEESRSLLTADSDGDDDAVSHDHKHSHSHDHAHNHKLSSIEAPGLHSQGHSHSHDHDHSHSLSASSAKARKKSTSSAASTSLWLALVVHSLMEGFGVGVTSSPLKQTTLVMAILIHKGFASLALASALLESGMDHKRFLSLFLAFSLASPLGAMLACLVQLEGGSTVLSGVVTGLASGSFMYIGFMEMLPAMLSSCQNMTDAMALFVFSAVAMAALAAFV